MPSERRPNTKGNLVAMVVALSITLTLLVTLVVALSSHGASLDRYAADGDVPDECTVAFDRGLAIGTRRQTFGGMAYCAYEGIPYVQPPIGKLRFEDPQPYHFEGARFFRNVSKACPQAFTDDIYKLETSEDCLYLNVYTRKQGLWSTKQNSSRSMMPILLWIHGGSFVVGSSETDIFGPEFLVEKGIIVVTFNYRLAMLGFLSLPDLGINANLGLLDQLEALRWTVRNAASFGGDASRITLCGWSAGAASVTYHLYSPAAKGLFHNAIIMSGTMTQSWAFDYDPDRCGRKYLQANDVTSHEQLQDLPLDQLMELSHESRVIYFSLYHFCFMPSDDSYRLEPDLRFVGKDPFELVRSTAPVSDVPLLVGYTALEQSNLYYDGDFSNTSANFPNTNATVYELIGKYFDRWATAAGNRSMSRRRFYQELVGISDIIYGIQYFIRHTATHQKAPLYRYLFAYDGAFGYAKNVYYRNQLTRPNLTGPMHGDDLGYLFTPYLYRGKHQQDIADAGYQTERRVQRRMLRLWSNFIKYGNPTPEPEPGRDRNDTDGGRQPVRWYPYNDPDPKRARHYLRIGRRNQLLPEADDANPLHQIWKPVFQCLYEFDCDFLSAEVDD